MLSVCLRKVILGKSCPAGEVRVKGMQQRQHLLWTHASLENMEAEGLSGRGVSFLLLFKKRISALVGKMCMGTLVTCAAQQKR